MPTLEQTIVTALNNRLKLPGFEVKVTIAALGHRQPIMVYFDLYYPLKDGGELAHVSTEGINQTNLRNDEETIGRIVEELKRKYVGRWRR